MGGENESHYSFAIHICHESRCHLVLVQFNDLFAIINHTPDPLLALPNPPKFIGCAVGGPCAPKKPAVQFPTTRAGAVVVVALSGLGAIFVSTLGNIVLL